MAYLPPEAHQLFAENYGVASIAELSERGLGRRARHRLLDAGSLDVIIPGVYRTPSVRLDELGRCRAVCLARPESAIAGPTAGRIWGFRCLPHDQRVHTLSPPHSHPVARPWVVPYRTKAFHSDDIVERDDGIRVTSRARTAFDLARHVGDASLLSIMEQAMKDGRLSTRELYEAAASWVCRQRPWASRFLRQLEGRVAGGPAESDLESRFGAELKRLGVRGLVRQYEIELGAYGRARFDLAIPQRRLAIEIDGFPTHFETAGLAADRRRDGEADRLGWRVRRFGPPQLGRRLPETAACFAAELLSTESTYR